MEKRVVKRIEISGKGLKNNDPARKFVVKRPKSEVIAQRQAMDMKNLASEKEDLFRRLGRMKKLEAELGLVEYQVFKQEVEYWRKYKPAWVAEFCALPETK